ncbi:MAG: O-antigen ligase family protein [Bacteroidales bacterium]|nr:O-antigen ligase family protein [Bacteroidales bacterium]
MAIKRTAFFILIILFFISSLYVEINPVFRWLNKIIGIGFVPYWLLFSRGLKFPSYLIRYLSFILYSICISIVVNANWEGVWGQAKTMLQLGVMLFFVYNISLSLKLGSNLLFLAFFLTIYFLLVYFGASFGLAPTESQVGARMTGMSANPNALGFIILYGLISLLYIFESKENPLYRLISNNWYLIFMLFLLLLLPTGSRKSFASLLGTFIFYGLIKQRNVLRSILGMSLIIGFGYILFWNTLSIKFESSKMAERITNEQILQHGFDDRKYLYIEAMDLFVEHPLFGIGLANFQFKSTSGQETHSYYMEMLSCTGIVGFAIIFSIYYLMGKRVYRLYKNQVAIDESIFIFNFLFITFLMSFGYTYHLSFNHWFVVTFIFVFLESSKHELKNFEG